MTRHHHTSRYITTELAANYCGFSPRTFEKYRITGDGPRYFKRGKRVLYRIDDCDAWMEAGCRLSTSDNGSTAR